MIIDNSTIHSSRKVKQFIEVNPSIRLFYLPAYSHDYNPIERFWEWLKSKIYSSGAYCDIDGICTAIRKFIWDYHEGRRCDKIKFNYETYAALL